MKQVIILQTYLSDTLFQRNNISDTEEGVFPHTSSSLFLLKREREN